MRKLLLSSMLLLLGVIVSGESTFAQDAAEIMKKSHLAYYYAGNDGIAEVSMRLISKSGKERKREFTMLRLDLEDGGNQKYYTYFKNPSDVSRTTFMVHKTTEGNDKRWIYVPSVDLIKQISADDKNSSFVGSDFTYEDVSGRHWLEDNHTFKEEGMVDSSAVYIIESIPKEEYKGFSRKLSYIDKSNMLPLKEEYFDKKDNMIRLFIAEKIEDIEGQLTVTLRSMENLKKKTKTYVEFSKITYDAGLKDDLFTERYLKNPPREYIK